MVYCALFPIPSNWSDGGILSPFGFAGFAPLSTDAGESILVLILAGPIPSFQVLFGN